MDENPYRSPESVATVARGGTRRILGWIIFVPSALLSARITWNWLTWHNLTEEEWNRILVLGTLGVFLMVCGCALIYSARLAFLKRSSPA